MSGLEFVKNMHPLVQNFDKAEVFINQRLNFKKQAHNLCCVNKSKQSLYTNPQMSWWTPVAEFKTVQSVGDNLPL